MHGIIEFDCAEISHLQRVYVTRVQCYAPSVSTLCNGVLGTVIQSGPGIKLSMTKPKDLIPANAFLECNPATPEMSSSP
jgi:hypothetical protein